MARPALEWAITDTHFFHDNIVEWCGRPENHTNLMLKNARHYVAAQDTLIHLGDVIFYKYDKLKSMLDSIPCRKVLVMGNHDRKSRNWYMRNGFDYAADMIVIDDILLSHKPVKDFPTGVRINIHGHFHNTDHRRHEPEYNDWYNQERYRLLAMEYTDYKPVKLRDFAR